MIIDAEDEAWLRQDHPGLAVGESGVSGVVEFCARYDQASNRFVRLDGMGFEGADGDALSCKFHIGITPPIANAASELPALVVRGIPPTADRHCSSGVACLCSPLEEDEFLRPAFQFRPFFERLVIPFLYGQEFATRNGRWPWGEYAHGATGLLESYCATGGEAARCLQKLSITPSWRNLKALLLQRSVGGHTRCICPKQDHFRRCHPRALEGLRRLHHAIREQKLALP